MSNVSLLINSVKLRRSYDRWRLFQILITYSKIKIDCNEGKIDCKNEGKINI